MYRYSSIVLLLMVVIATSSGQLLIKETFNYPGVGGLVDCSLLNITSPYYPVAVDSLGVPDWINGATSAFDGPVLVDSGALTYPGYSLSGRGKKVYLPSILTSPRQTVRRAYPAQSGKVYFAMMVKMQEQYMLGTLVNGVIVDKASQDLNGTTIACINTSTSSSGIRGLLVFVRADTIGGTQYGKYLAGVSYKRDDVATKFASTKLLDTLQTYLMVVCTDPATAKTSLWINPDFSSVEPAPDAVCTNADGAETILPIYFSIYQRSGFPSGWLGGIRVGTSWVDMVGPEYSADTDGLSFDSLVTHSQKSDTVVISNSGSAPLTITSITTTHADFTVTPTSASVPGGSSLAVVVTARLTGPASRTGSLIINHSASAQPDTITLSVHRLILPSQPVMTETFNYRNGGLDAGNPVAVRLNVSGGWWVCGTSSTFTDSISVESPSLQYPGYSLSGIGKRIFLPNDVAASSNDRAYRSFEPQTGKVYYSVMIDMKDAVNLSSNTSTNGEYVIGLWPSTASSNALFRGLLTVRTGSVAGTYQLGIRATQPTANTATVWVTRDLAPATTHLVVVSYERGSLPIAKLWVDPDLSGREPAPDAVSSVSVAMSDNADIGRFGIYQRGNTPHARFGGLRIGTTWNSFQYPVLGRSKTRMDLGTVAIGMQKSDSIILTNSGDADLIFNTIRPLDSIFTISPSKGIIAPGASVALLVSALQDTATYHVGELIIHHNGIAFAETIAVSVNRPVIPVFTVSATALLFGPMAVGATKMDSVIVTNTGEAPLQITAVTSSHPVFVVSPTSALIPHAGSQTFIITATLDSAKHRSASIIFSHNAAGSPDTLQVSLQSLVSVNSTSHIPLEFALYQNYPNPFNPSTSIPFTVARNENITVTIYDMLGRMVDVLVQQPLNAGSYTAVWNASERSSGIYLCRLQNGREVRTIKIMLMK